MKTTMPLFLSLFIAIASTKSLANITVEAIQPPVWKLQNGQKTALFVGDNIQANDILLSGKNSRILLNMGEGSGLELGETSEINLPKTPNPESNIAEAIINIIEGAFRFTTGTFAANKARAMSFNLRNSTVGIRGTDVWGSTNNTSDYVVLIEGNIDISHNSSQQTINMQTPNTVYQAPLTSTPLPLNTINPTELKQLAQQTHLLTSKPAIYKNGIYSVVIGSAQNPAHAAQLSLQYQQAGYPVISQAATVNGVNYTRAQINGFKHLKDAQAFTQQLQNELNISDAWILKNRF